MTPAPDMEEERPRPLWLITLADLALLLIGFFVLLQAAKPDGAALAAGMRAGFGIESAPPEMPVALASVDGFGPGSIAPPDAAPALRWAHDMARDPRTRIRVTGEVDGSAADVDPLTGSGPILAADRARAIAALLVRSGAIRPERLVIATASGKARRVVLTLGFDGGGKDLPSGNATLPADRLKKGN